MNVGRRVGASPLRAIIGSHHPLGGIDDGDATLFSQAKGNLDQLGLR
jgi:hypothetical protein